MARPGLLRHRKFIRLARLLGSDALAVGHLEIIWQAAYEAGDPKIGTAADLEYLARWQGEEGKLAAAMIESGFMELADGADIQVHDLVDHAPDYVQRRMEREDERRKKGQTISALRAAAGREGAKAKLANAQQMTDVCQANGATPAPSTRSQHAHPTPAPAQKKPAPPEGGFPPDLLVWIDWWNGLRAEGCVPCAVASDPPSQAILKAYARAQSSAECRDLLDREKLATAIRQAPFCREGWFRLEKLLSGKNRDGEFISRKLLDGGYAENAPRKPDHATGKRYDPTAPKASVVGWR